MFVRLVNRLQRVSFSSSTTSIDSNEVKHFARLADLWWNNRKALINLNRLRMPHIMSVINRNGFDCKKVDVLDVGCGGGFISEALAVEGANVTGLDPAKELIDIAVAHKSLTNTPLANLQYRHDTVENYATTHPQRHDVVIASEVLEHVANVPSFVAHCVQCLKPGGLIYFTTINRTFLAYLYYIVLLEGINEMPKGTHTYEKLVKSDEVNAALTQNGCKVHSIAGFTFNPLTRNWFWTPRNYTGLNYAVYGFKQL